MISWQDNMGAKRISGGLGDTGSDTHSTTISLGGLSWIALSQFSNYYTGITVLSYYPNLLATCKDCKIICVKFFKTLKVPCTKYSNHREILYLMPYFFPCKGLWNIHNLGYITEVWKCDLMHRKISSRFLSACTLNVFTSKVPTLMVLSRDTEKIFVLPWAMPRKLIGDVCPRRMPTAHLVQWSNNNNKELSIILTYVPYIDYTQHWYH